MNNLKPLRRRDHKIKEYLDAPHCSECKSRNVYYRATTNDYQCRRCGAKTIGPPKWRKEKSHEV